MTWGLRDHPLGLGRPDALTRFEAAVQGSFTAAKAASGS